MEEADRLKSELIAALAHEMRTPLTSIVGYASALLFNLLDNAVKCSPEGGLVVVRGQLAGDEVIVSVADNGIGIVPEHLNRLFEKFIRVKSPLGQQVSSSGLGVPVSRTTVGSH